MIISHDWLKQYVHHDLSAEALADALTFQCCPIESIEDAGDGDTALELEVTFNRSDLLSHLGVAREVAAATGASITEPTPEPAGDAGAPVTEHAAVEVEAADLCPRYTARVVRGVKIGPSPDWLVKRIEAIGLRPVNNVVDITNFVLHECGQPLHAFDLAKLAGAKVVIRRARKGETMTAINGDELKLGPETLVIADAERPVAVAGIMGGLDTEISEATTDVLIESAYFDPIATRQAVRRLGLRSDSSHRFERGVDPARVDWASRRTAELITELAGGTLCEGVIDADAGSLPGPQRITLRLSRLTRVAGFEISGADAARILAGLALGVDADEAAGVLHVTVPTARHEVTREVDLIEEVLRVYGFENVPEADSLPIAVAPRDEQERTVDELKQVLVGAGYREVHTLSFVAAGPYTDPPLFSALAPRTIRNPVRQETPALRRSLFGSLLEIKRVNETKGTREVRLFEASTVYLPTEAEGADVDERLMLGLLADDDPLGVKGAFEAVARALGLADRVAVEPLGVLEADTFGPVPCEPTDAAGVFQGGACGHVVLLPDGDAAPQPIGWIGRVSAEAARHHEVKKARPSVLLVDLGAMLAAARLERHFEPISAYPEVARDLAVVVPSDGAWTGHILREAEAARAGQAALCGVELLSVFEGDGKSVSVGQRSVAIRLRCQASDRTLTGAEADAVREAVKARLESRFGATFRE